MIKMGQVSSCLRSAGGALGTLWGCSPSKAVTGRDRYRQLRTSAASHTYTQGISSSTSSDEAYGHQALQALLSGNIVYSTKHLCLAVETYDVPTSRITRQLTSVLNARDLAEACRGIAPGESIAPHLWRKPCASLQTFPMHSPSLRSMQCPSQ